MQMATSIETDNGEMIVKRVSVPIGLEELMEGLTKEVILKKPKDICVFASEYFANLLNLREKGSLRVGPGKTLQSVTKQFSADQLKKQLKVKSRSVDPIKSLTRQKSIRPDSPTKRNLTTKKIVLNSKEEKEKAAEKTKTFLDKRKARKGSKDETNKRQQAAGQNDKRERKMSRTSERSTSRSTEDSIRTPRKSSQSESKQEIPNDSTNKTSVSKNVKEINNLNQLKNIKLIDNDVKLQEIKDIESSCKGNNEIKILDNNAMEDVKSNNIVGCTMKDDQAVDTVVDQIHEQKLITPPEVEKIEEQMETKNNEENINESKDEVDFHDNKNKENVDDQDVGNKNIDVETKPKNETQSHDSNENPTNATKQDSLQANSPHTLLEENKDTEEKMEQRKSEGESHDATNKKPKDLSSVQEKDFETENLNENEKINISSNNKTKPNETESESNNQDINSEAKNENLQNQENKENIDVNKEETEDATVNEMPDTSVLSNKEVKVPKKSKVLGRKSSTEESKTKNKDDKKIKRIKSVDSSMLNKSKSKMTSLNDENQDENVNVENGIKTKRSKRSTSVDMIKDHKILAETQLQGFNPGKLREELKGVNELTKATTFKTSYNPYKLRQEIKEASGDIKSTEKSGLSQAAGELVAALKIQALWRGFTCRKLLRSDFHGKENITAASTTGEDNIKKSELGQNHTNDSKEEHALEGVQNVKENNQITDQEKNKITNDSIADSDVNVEQSIKNDRENNDAQTSESEVSKDISTHQNDEKSHENRSNNDNKENIDEKVTEITKPQEAGELSDLSAHEDVKETASTQEVQKLEEAETSKNIINEDLTNGKIKKEDRTTTSEDIQNTSKDLSTDGKIKVDQEEENNTEKVIETVQVKSEHSTSSNDAIENNLEDNDDKMITESGANIELSQNNVEEKTENTQSNEVEEHNMTKKISAVALENFPQSLTCKDKDENKIQEENQAESIDQSHISHVKLDMADAVTKIQALWRGLKVRKHLEKEKLFGATVQKETHNKEALELVKRDRHKAVSKIQALWRGYMVRKNIKEVNNRLADLQKPTECDEMPSQRTLTDEDIFKAATKIQANVRGYMVRKRRNNVCHLQSITEENTPEGRLSDEQVFKSLEELQNVPVTSPEISVDETQNMNEQENDSSKNKHKDSDPEGNKGTKNNSEINTEENNKKTDTEVKFIAPELNSSTTNKLSNLDTSAIIDDSISNSSVNKNQVDPDSSIIHDEPGYEDAPTRPVTSNTLPEPTNTRIPEADGNSKTETQNVNEDAQNEKDLNKINENHKSFKESKGKILSSQESSASVDSVATVIFNDLGAQAVPSQDECDEKLLSSDESKEGVQKTDDIHTINQSDETDKGQDGTIKKAETLNGHEEIPTEENIKEKAEITETNPVLNEEMPSENSSEINNNLENATSSIQTDTVGNENEQNEAIIKDESKDETSNVDEDDTARNNKNEEQDKKVEDSHKNLNHKSSLSGNNVNEAGNNKNEEQHKTLENSHESLNNESPLGDNNINETAEKIAENDNNKLNLSTLQNEIINSNQTDSETSVSPLQVSKDKDSDSLSNDLLTHLRMESDHNKLNTTALESEIENSNKQLQKMLSKNSEELSEYADDEKAHSLDISSIDETKTDDSVSLDSTSDNKQSNKETNTDEEEKDDAPKADKDVLRIHIPLRELSEIKEEDGDVKSSTESVEDLEDESKLNGSESISSGTQSEQVQVQETEDPTKNINEVNNTTIKEKEDDENSKDVESVTHVSESKVEEHKENENSKTVTPDLVKETKTEASSQEGSRQSSAGATISLVHSGEFHDGITVPISITPPARSSPKEDQKQSNMRQASPPGLVHTGELHDNILPVSVQLNEAPPAGAEVLTSVASESINTDGQGGAQASNKDASTCETQPDNISSSAASMETEKRNNATTIQKKSMEAEAATKIQAGFRGYQVRKQLKNKISSPGDISNQRRSARRKSSGRISESGRIVQNKSKSPSEVEEKSATKIQAGVRGFLVRRRQKNKQQKPGKESS